MDVLLPEWSPRRALVLRWPWRPDIWPNAGRDAQAAVVQLLQTITQPLRQRGIRVELEVPGAYLAFVRTQVPQGVEVIASVYADIWIRDCAPFYVGPGAEPSTHSGPERPFTMGDNLERHAVGRGAGIQYQPTIDVRSYVTQFNGWAGLDTDFADDLSARDELCHRFDLNPRKLPIVLEGGSIHTNGRGMLVYIQQAVLDPGRNPLLTQGHLHRMLEHDFCTSRIVALDGGLASDETGGHTDNLMTFLTPSLALVSTPEHPGHPDYANAKACADALREIGIEVIAAPQPELTLSAAESRSIIKRSGVKYRPPGMPLTATYANGIRVDDIYVVPQFGVPDDERVTAAIKAACPHLTVLTAPARALLAGGGGWHCASHTVV